MAWDRGDGWVWCGYDGILSLWVGEEALGGDGGSLRGGDGSFRGPTGEAFVGQWMGGAVGKEGWLCNSTK
jgi:hypothetical protein